MESAEKTLQEVRARIASSCERSGRNPREVALIGAAKTVSAARLSEFGAAGLQDIGENYVQEAIRKQRELEEESSTRSAFRWHFIGALQSNKARDVVGRFALIHSVDRASLAQALDKEAGKIGVVQSVLLQVNIGDESSKAGCAPDELGELARFCRALPHLRVCGLMCLPPAQENAQNARPFLRRLRELRDELNAQRNAQTQLSTRLDDEAMSQPLTHLSMGMSHDFEVAIEEGATLVRLGTLLFGARG